MYALRNFSSSFIDGITGTALKKDNVKKHQLSDMHSKAVNLERKPATLTDIDKLTPLGRAFSSGQQEERAHVCKLLEIAYMIAMEEIPFTKYPAIMELEKGHGVSLGSAYTTEHKCREFSPYW